MLRERAPFALDGVHFEVEARAAHHCESGDTRDDAHADAQAMEEDPTARPLQHTCTAIKICLDKPCILLVDKNAVHADLTLGKSRCLGIHLIRLPDVLLHVVLFR